MEHSVKFYSSSDLSASDNLRKAQALLDKGLVINNINYALLAYNIDLFFQNKLRLKTWTDDTFNHYKALSKSLLSETYKFFSSISEESICQSIIEIEYLYRSDFWVLFEKTKCYERISEECFYDILNSKYVLLQDILKQNKTVTVFKEPIRWYFLQNFFTAETLLNKHSRKSEKKKIYIPSNLTLDDKEFIIENYIDEEKVNINYLNLIAQILPSSELQIKDKLRLKAKRKYDEKAKEIFENGIVITNTAKVFFAEQEETVRCEYNFATIDGKIELCYDINWINNNTDYPTLLNNFIYLFEFVDSHMIFTNVYNKHKLGLFEKISLPEDPTFYPSSRVFQMKLDLVILTMLGYYTELQDLKIQIEEIIEWFFKDYILQEFGIPSFSIQMPSINSPYIDKCSSVITVIDSILKEFTLLVEEGEVDKELLSMLSTSRKLSDIPSFINDKYAYGVGKTYENITYLLFSDQCLLSYTQKTQDKYKSFYKLINNTKISMVDFEEWKHEDINWLISEEIIKIDEHDNVIIQDVKTVNILKRLYEYEVLNVKHCSNVFKSTLTKLKEKGYIHFKTSFFAKNESNFLNYMLNKSNYRNSLDLRNKYAHGNQQIVDNDDIHRGNYMLFLYIVILLIIKINDELCLKAKDAELSE